VRELGINGSSVLAATIDEDVTAIEGYGFGWIGVAIPQIKEERLLQGGEAFTFRVIIGNKLDVVGAILRTYFGVAQVELMTEHRIGLIRVAGCVGLLCPEISPLYTVRTREHTGTLLPRDCR